MKRFILSVIFISICSVGFSQADQADSVKPRKPLKQRQSRHKASDKDTAYKIRHANHDTLSIVNNKADSTARKKEEQ